MKRDSFIMYTSFYEPVKDFSDEQLGQLFRAIFANRREEESECHLTDAAVKIAFRFIANQFAVDDSKYEKTYAQRIKAAEASVNARKRSLTSVNLNENVNENDNVNVNVIKEKDKEKVAVAPLAPKSSSIKRFIKPTLLELQQYCQEARLNINCDAFLDYYEANGWKVGRDSMKDWRAAARNWARRQVPEKRSNIVDNIHNIGDFSNERTRI